MLPLLVAAKSPAAWLVVLCGVFIVFLGMLMLTAILYIMDAINKSKSKKAEKKEAGTVTKAEEKSEPEEAAVNEAAESEEEEIAAVIAAAISAYYSEKGRTSAIKASTVRRICRKVNYERKNG